MLKYKYLFDYWPTRQCEGDPIYATRGHYANHGIPTSVRIAWLELVPPVRIAVMFWVTRRPAGKARRGRIAEAM